VTGKWKKPPDDPRIVEWVNQCSTRFFSHSSSCAFPRLKCWLTHRDDASITLHIVQLTSGYVARDNNVSRYPSHACCQRHCSCMIATSYPMDFNSDSKLQKKKHSPPSTLNPPYATQRAVSPNLLCVRTPFCAPSSESDRTALHAPRNLKAPLHIPQSHLTLNLADNPQW
jgi:hypothetical protein